MFKFFGGIIFWIKRGREQFISTKQFRYILLVVSVLIRKGKKNKKKIKKVIVII